MMFRLLIVMLLAIAALPAHAAGASGMFGSGRTQFSLTAGNAYAFEKRYSVIGGSVSYYLAEGLGVGLSLARWSGEGPVITKYAPFVQYAFLPISGVRPYIGGFYRHTDIDGLPGLKSAGARGGVLMASGRNAYLGIGVVYEAYLDCQPSVYRVCRETYPDFNLSFGF